jgi:G3E family GTPase
MAFARRQNCSPRTQPVALQLAGPPLVLLVGLLGSGKTTFLRALLGELRGLGLRTRVLLNDHHNAQLDAATVAPLADRITTLSGSCVCCESAADLIDQLSQPPADSGEIQLVETNGTTDAAALRALIAGSAVIRHWTPLQINLVDCQRWQTDPWQNDLERAQFAGADRLAFSRRDVVPRSRFEEVAHAASILAPAAARTDPARLAAQLLALSQVRRWQPAMPVDPRPEMPHTHLAELTSVEIRLPRRLNEEEIGRWLAALPPEVQRLKGLSPVAPRSREAWVFQRVGARHDVWRQAVHGPRPAGACAVLLGRNLDAAVLCQLTEQLFA